MQRRQSQTDDRGILKRAALDSAPRGPTLINCLSEFAQMVAWYRLVWSGMVGGCQNWSRHVHTLSKPVNKFSFANQMNSEASLMLLYAA